jgi:hypothetical protein
MFRLQAFVTNADARLAQSVPDMLQGQDVVNVSEKDML